MKLNGIVQDDLVRWVELAINAIGLGMPDEEIVANLMIAENGFGILPEHSTASKALVVAKMLVAIEDVADAAERSGRNHG